MLWTAYGRGMSPLARKAFVSRWQLLSVPWLVEASLPARPHADVQPRRDTTRVWAESVSTTQDRGDSWCHVGSRAQIREHGHRRSRAEPRIHEVYIDAD